MKIINLLPKAKQQELYYESILHSLWALVIFSCVSFALVFLAQFGTKFYLQIQAQDIKQQITELRSQVNKQENSDVKTKVQAANNLVADYQNLVNSAPKWSKLVKAFAPLPPQGLKINSFNVDPATRSIQITGISPTRELVIALYNNVLGDTTDFYGIDYPLENITQETNISFHFTFYYYAKVIQ